MIPLLLLLFAFVLFVLAGLGLPQPARLNFIGWGLACAVLAEIIMHSGLLSVPK